MIENAGKSEEKKFVIKSWGFVQESPYLDNKPKKNEKKTHHSDD